MGDKVHWSRGEHPLSVVANTFNMVAPTLSATATTLTVFTGGAVLAFGGDTASGSVMLASAIPQLKMLRLNWQHSRHTVEKVKELNTQTEQRERIERETDAEASHRCRLAFARLAAPLVIFAAAYGLARFVEAPQPEPMPVATQPAPKA